MIRVTIQVVHRNAGVTVEPLSAVEEAVLAGLDYEEWYAQAPKPLKSLRHPPIRSPGHTGVPRTQAKALVGGGSGAGYRPLPAPRASL